MTGVVAEAVAPALITESDVKQYLAEQASRTSFVMVEIGHGALPVAYRRPGWEGERHYYGVEGWLRNMYDAKRLGLLKEVAERPNPNIRFIDLELGGEVKRVNLEAEGYSWYVGDYDPVVPLPNNMADEVVLSNVVGDPHVATSPERTQSLLTEASRLLASNGVVVVRETISPERAIDSLTEEALGVVDLRSIGRHEAKSEVWETLEGLYDGTRTDDDTDQLYQLYARRNEETGAFYQFLAKA